MDKTEVDKNAEQLSERMHPRIHKGVTLLIADFHGMMDEKEIVRLAHYVTGRIIESNRKEIRLLVNVQLSLDSAAGQVKFAEAARQIKPYCKKIAVIGITPVKNAIMTVINKITGLGIRGFATELEALEWLIK